MISQYVSHLGHLDYAHITWINAPGRLQIATKKTIQNPTRRAWIFFGVLEDQKNYKLILKKEEIEAPARKKKDIGDVWTLKELYRTQYN